MARPINDPIASAIAGLSRVIETSQQNEVNAVFAAAVNAATASQLSQTVRLYGIGANPKALTSDLAAIQKMASRLEKDNHISFADVATDIARFVPAPPSNMYFGNGQADKWELSLDQAVAAGILDHVKLNPLESYKDPSPPVSHPHPAYGKRRLSTSARAANAAASMPWNQSGNVDRSAVFTGRADGDIPDLNNPPRWDNGGAGGVPPGGNQPPGPPDEPPDDNDGILRQLLEFFQRMFGVRPDIANRNFLDTLANNLTSILGGVIPPADANGQRPSAAATLMDTFADYFGVPRETEDATREAQENLRRSIDRLTDATNGAANGTPTQPQTRWQRFKGFFRRSGRTRKSGIATATRLASFMRPLFRGIANTIPSRWRQAAGQMGANIAGRVGPMLGIPAATAARFGAAAPMAMLAVGVLAKAIPVIGTVITATIGGLNKLADQALKTTFALASYGGMLAHANAQLEVNREMRKFDLANKMGGFGAERLGQLNRLENAMQPWQIMGNNAGNLFGSLVDSGLATALEILNNLLATGMDINATLLKWLVPGDQGEDNMRKAAAKLRNPAADMPQQWEGREAVFGQNAVDMIDFGKRVAGPRKPVNGGN